MMMGPNKHRRVFPETPGKILRILEEWHCITPGYRFNGYLDFQDWAADNCEGYWCTLGTKSWEERNPEVATKHRYMRAVGGNGVKVYFSKEEDKIKAILKWL